jgi:hypothetical protein
VRSILFWRVDLKNKDKGAPKCCSNRKMIAMSSKGSCSAFLKVKSVEQHGVFEHLFFFASFSFILILDVCF